MLTELSLILNWIKSLRDDIVLNTEVPYVRYLDRLDREDVRLHQPRCHNASTYGLRGYVDITLPSRYVITMILRVHRKILKLLRSPTAARRR